MKLTVVSLRSLVRLALITEGRVEDLTAKHPEVDVLSLAVSDPSPTKKYLTWMVKQVRAGVRVEDLVPTIKYFHDNAHKFPSKDINTYKTLKELEDAAKLASEKKTKGEVKREISSNEAPKVYEDENVLVIRPDTKRACIKYGAGSKWCITMEDANYYEQYTGANVVFYFMFMKVPVKNKNHEKIAIAMKRRNNNEVDDWEVYDAADNQISMYKPAESCADKVSMKRSLAWVLDTVQIDAAKQPKSLLAKIKSGDDVDPNELIAHWESLGEGEPGSTAFASKCAMLDAANRKNTAMQICRILEPAESDPELKEAMHAVTHDPMSNIEFGGGIAYYTPTGEPHRDDDKPAIITTNGLRVWKKSGDIHRDGAPAIIGHDGTEGWYRNGMLHREDGPAEITPDDSPEGWREEYFLLGHRFKSIAKWEEMVAEIQSRRNVSEPV